MLISRKRLLSYFRIHMTVITQLSISFVAPNDLHDWELVCNRIENIKQLFIELSVIFHAMTHFVETQTTIPIGVACAVFMCVICQLFEAMTRLLRTEHYIKRS